MFVSSIRIKAFDWPFFAKSSNSRNNCFWLSAEWMLSLRPCRWSKLLKIKCVRILAASLLHLFCTSWWESAMMIILLCEQRTNYDLFGHNKVTKWYTSRHFTPWVSSLSIRKYSFGKLNVCSTNVQMRRFSWKNLVWGYQRLELFKEMCHGFSWTNHEQG